MPHRQQLVTSPTCRQHVPPSTASSWYLLSVQPTTARRPNLPAKHAPTCCQQLVESSRTRGRAAYARFCRRIKAITVCARTSSVTDRSRDLSACPHSVIKSRSRNQNSHRSDLSSSSMCQRDTSRARLRSRLTKTQCPTAMRRAPLCPWLAANGQDNRATESLRCNGCNGKTAERLKARSVSISKIVMSSISKHSLNYCFGLFDMLF